MKTLKTHIISILLIVLIFVYIGFNLFDEKYQNKQPVLNNPAKNTSESEVVKYICVEIEGHEYLVFLHGVVHKENCKFCVK